LEPGKPSIVSDPIPHAYEPFLNEIVLMLKYPVLPEWEGVLKEVKIVEGSSPDEFEVKVILDAQKLNAVGFGNKEDPALDRVTVYNKVKVDRAKRCIVTNNYAEHWQGEEAAVVFNTHAQFTTDPFQLDYHWILPDGTRKADEMVQGSLQFFVNGVMQALADRKVVIKMDSDKKVFTCDPIDAGVVTYEPLFDAMVGILKAPPGQPTLEEISEEKFKVIPQVDHVPYQVYTCDKEKGTILCETYSHDGTKKIATTNFIFSKSPLTLENYIESDGERVIGEGGRRRLQTLVDGSIAKATQGWGLGIF